MLQLGKLLHLERSHLAVSLVFTSHVSFSLYCHQTAGYQREVDALLRVNRQIRSSPEQEQLHRATELLKQLLDHTSLFPPGTGHQNRYLYVMVPTNWIFCLSAPCVLLCLSLLYHIICVCPSPIRVFLLGPSGVIGQC